MPQLPSISTGGSSLYLGDFAKPLYGITQNLTKAMIDQYARRKQEGDQDRAALLNALSFDAVEGLSEKVSQELLKKYSDFEDEWVRKYMDNNLRLSDADYFALNKGKRELDQYAAKLKSNVANFAYQQKLYLQDPEAWHPKSAQNIKNAVDNGLIGTELNNLLVPMFDVNDYLKKRYASVLSDSKKISTTRNYDREGNVVNVESTNDPYVDEVIKSFEQDPVLKQWFNDPMVGEQVRAGAMAFADNYRIKSTKQEAPRTVDIKDWELKNLPKAQREFKEKYGVDDPTGNYESMSELLHGLTRGDKKSINTIVGQKAPDGGKITRVKVHPEKITIVSEITKGTGDKKETTESEIDIETPDWTDRADVQTKLMELYKYIPKGLKGGGQIETSRIPAEYEMKSFDPAEYASVEDVMSNLSYKAGEKVGDQTVYDFEHRQGIVDLINEAAPELNARTEDWKLFRPDKWGNSTMYLTIDGKEKAFELKNEKDREDIKKVVKKYGGRKDQPKQYAEPAASTVNKNTKVEDGEKKQAVLDDIYKVNAVSVDDYIKTMTSPPYNKSVSEVQQIIDSVGITDEDIDKRMTYSNNKSKPKGELD